MTAPPVHNKTASNIRGDGAAPELAESMMKALRTRNTDAELIV